jgi:hypothetical protein
MKSRRVEKSIRGPRDVDLVVKEQIIEKEQIVNKEQSNVSSDQGDFSSVGMQQGRVPLDPDSNEQGAIDDRPQRFKKKLNKP